MRRVALVLLACSLLLGAASCGDDDEDEGASADGGEAVSTEEFIEQGDAICQEFADRAAEVSAPESEGPDQARFFGELIAVGEDALADFRALEPPADGEEVHAALIDALETGLETLGGAQDAAESGDTVTAGDLMAQATAESDAADEAAREYGFEVCGAED